MINKNDLLKLVDDEIDIEKREMPFAYVEGAGSVFTTQLKIDAIGRIKKIIVEMEEVIGTENRDSKVRTKLLEKLHDMDLNDEVYDYQWVR